MISPKDWSWLWRKLHSPRQMESDIDDEIRFHIEGRIDALMEAARQKAHADFGDMGRIRAEIARVSDAHQRRRRREEFMGSLIRDVALTFRELRRNPGFAAVALLTLTLGIGANTAMFSVLNGVVLRPAPYQDPHRLVAVWPAMNFNMTLVDSIASKTTSLESLSGISYWSLTLTGDGPAESLNAAVVSTDYFHVLGVPPFRGRGFGPEEVDPSRSDVAVLAHGFWVRRFGSDPSVLGRRIRLEGYGHETRQVIGIAPPGFQPPDRRVDAWIPLHLSPGHTVATDSTWYVNQVVGRMAPGVTVARASSDVARAAAEIYAQFPQRIQEDLVRQAGVVPLMNDLLGDAGFLLWVLFGAVALVLLMACANLANLLLARGGRRAHEAAVRTALGASRSRLARQHLTSAFVLSALGGLFGVLLAWVLLRVLLPGLDATHLPRSDQIRISPAVLGFTATVAMVSAVVFGLLPALRVGREGLRKGMEAGGRGRAGDRSSHGLNRTLVAVETAMAVVLVMGAGLMLRSMWRLAGTDPGFNPEGVIAMQIMPSSSRYQNQGEISRAFLARVEEGIRGIPGVEDFGAIHLLPLTTNNWNFPYLAEGHLPPENAPLPSANFRIVTPAYFRTMEIPLLQGREFTDSDGPDDESVGLVNESMARLLWPGEEAVGKEILLFGSDPFRVVGVVGDVRQHGLRQDVEPEMYRPFRQYSWPGVVMMVKAPSSDAGRLAPALREAVWSADPDVPVPSIQNLTDVLSNSLAQTRLYAQLLAAFGLLALVLGVVGIYGVMSYVVGGRQREFGVRIALGAQPATVVAEALRMGMVPVGAGLAGGALVALLSMPLLRSALYGVAPADPPTLMVVLGVLAAAGLVANWLPARRASRVDPIQVLSAD